MAPRPVAAARYDAAGPGETNKIPELGLSLDRPPAEAPNLGRRSEQTMSEMTTDTRSKESETRSDKMSEGTSDTMPTEPAEPTTTTTNDSILMGPGAATATV